MLTGYFPLSRVLGESVTAGQRCRLPKCSEPKFLRIYDIINVVRGSDERESDFTARTPYDGIDLEYDGLCELFVTVNTHDMRLQEQIRAYMGLQVYAILCFIP